jgi:8-oxo-dGTP diphosphatase
MKDVAVGILAREGMILACQRRRDAAYGLKWEFPGGKVEPGETPAGALRRELKEELDIDAVIGREFYRQKWVYPAGPQAGIDGAFRVHYFLVESFSGTPVNRAFERILWTEVEKFPELDFLEGNRDAIARYGRVAAGRKRPP